MFPLFRISGESQVRGMGTRNLNQWSVIIKEALNGTLNLAKIFCCLHITNTYIVTPTLPYGPSMLPALNLNGDIVLAERLTTRFGKVRSGDIVIARSPDNPRNIVMKRVVGVEGDRVSYVVPRTNGERSETIVVPEGHVWIQGDTMHVSNDSRHYGPVPCGLLQGRIFWRVWPPNAFGSLARKGE